MKIDLISGKKTLYTRNICNFKQHIKGKIFLL